MSAPPEPAPPRRRRWLRRLIVLSIVIVGVVLLLRLCEGPSVPARAYIVLDLRAALPERSGDGLAAFFGGSRLDLLGVRRVLEAGAHDARVRGAVVRVGGGAFDLAMAEEVRAMLAAFRKTGKFVVAHLDGADGPGYLAACSADEVLIDPAAPLGLIGVSLEPLFLGDALRRLGIDLDLVRVGEFKGAFEELTAAEPSPEFRRSLDETADSLYGSLVAEIAGSRSLRPEDVRAAVDAAPLLPAKAVETKLADGLKHADELRAAASARAGGPAEPMDAAEYLAAVGERGPGARLAVIHIRGLIVDEGGAGLPLFGETTSSSEAIAALRQAREDGSVRGIILRIDSPGGSMSASERIWREVDITRRVKPVVASMGSTAASGGYYAACGADRVVVRPATLTGSIGVFGGKVVVASFLQERGAKVVRIARGGRAGMMSPFHPFSDDERDAMERIIRDGYNRFVDRVSTGRKRSLEETEKVARGRVWTGAQAVSNGLADELGGLEEALAAVKTIAHLPASEEVDLVPFPPRRGWIDLLSGRPKEVLPGGPGAGVDAAARILRGLGLDGRVPVALAPVRLLQH